MPVDEDGEVWQVVILKRCEAPEVGEKYELAEVYEGTLHKVRKQACASYPSACKAFGGARSYAIFR